MELHYHLYDPTGNLTILVETPVDPAFQPVYGAALLKAEPTAEQVGYLSPGDGACDIALRMAGGEFCGNATISTAAYFAEKTGKTGTVLVRASGADYPLAVEVHPRAEGGYFGKLEMPRVNAPEWVELEDGGRRYTLPMLRVGGISHLIVTEPMERSAAEGAVRRWCAQLGAAGLGLMLLNEERDELTPLVYVPEGDTMYWEHSCASGTAAVGAYLAGRDGKMVEKTFFEPGGKLGVSANPDGKIFLQGQAISVSQHRFVTDSTPI